MNKKEFITAIAEKSHLTLEKAEEVLAVTFATIQEAMLTQESIAVAGFGSFSTKVREERKGRNPSTGQEMTIPKAIVPVFKASSHLKESINKSKEK